MPVSAPGPGVPIRAEGASRGPREPVQGIPRSNTRRTQLGGAHQLQSVGSRNLHVSSHLPELTSQHCPEAPGLPEDPPAGPLHLPPPPQNPPPAESLPQGLCSGVTSERRPAPQQHPAENSNSRPPRTLPSASRRWFPKTIFPRTRICSSDCRPSAPVECQPRAGRNCSADYWLPRAASRVCTEQRLSKRLSRS